MADVLVFPPGKIIQFTTGCYSDFGLHLLAVTLKETDLHALLKEFTEQYEPESEYDTHNHSAFTGWLIQREYILPIDCQTVSIGEYSDWGDLEPPTPRRETRLSPRWIVNGTDCDHA